MFKVFSLIKAYDIGRSDFLGRVETDPDPRMVQKESYKGRLNKACGIYGLAFKCNQFVDRTIEITWR